MDKSTKAKTEEAERLLIEQLKQNPLVIKPFPGMRMTDARMLLSSDGRPLRVTEYFEWVYVESGESGKWVLDNLSRRPASQTPVFDPRSRRYFLPKERPGRPSKWYDEGVADEYEILLSEYRLVEKARKKLNASRGSNVLAELKRQFPERPLEELVKQQLFFPSGKNVPSHLACKEIALRLGILDPSGDNVFDTVYDHVKKGRRKRGVTKSRSKAED